MKHSSMENDTWQVSMIQAAVFRDTCNIFSYFSPMMNP